MKPKLENLQEVLKVLEKQYEIPKHLYQIEFPKTQKKKKKKNRYYLEGLYYFSLR